MIREALKTLLAGDDLTPEAARETMSTIMSGQATPSQIAGFLIALKQKGETAPELVGFVRALRENAVKVELDGRAAVDGCGTGGDGAGTFNLSTAASLVAAGAGVPVAKHGNRSVSSLCGSADLLEALGGSIERGPEAVREDIEKIGFGFMFAPRFHPAVKHAAAPRRELGVRTVFNILGPLCNPAAVRRQALGVYDPSLMPLMAEVLELLEAEHAMVMHSEDGLDEFSISAPTRFIEIKRGSRHFGVVEPEQVGLRRHRADAVLGGDASHNAALLKKVFAGESSAFRDATILNAGALVYVGGRAESIAEGVRSAEKAVDSGTASDVLERWVQAGAREA